MKSYVQQRHEPDRFLLLFSWLRTSSPFCIGLIAKCEMSEGHSHNWLLFVSGLFKYMVEIHEPECRPLSVQWA